MSGHKSLKVFQGYVRINQKQNAEVLGKNEFFNWLLQGRNAHSIKTNTNK